MTQGPSENRPDTPIGEEQLKFEALKSPTLRIFGVDGRTVTDRPSIGLLKRSLRSLESKLPESDPSIHKFSKVFSWFLRTNPGMDAFGFVVQVVQFLHGLKKTKLSALNPSDLRSTLAHFKSDHFVNVFRAIPDIGRAVGFGDDVASIMHRIDWRKLDGTALHRLSDARIEYNGQLPILPPLEGKEPALGIPAWLEQGASAPTLPKKIQKPAKSEPLVAKERASEVTPPIPNLPLTDGSLPPLENESPPKLALPDQLPNSEPEIRLEPKSTDCAD